MSVTLVRQKVKDGSLEAAEAAGRELFATLNRVRPNGVRYASTRVADSSTFVILFELADGVEDPRPAIPEFMRFIEQLKGWPDGPPVIEHLDVVGSYQLFGAQREELAVRQAVRLGGVGILRLGTSHLRIQKRATKIARLESMYWRLGR